MAVLVRTANRFVRHLCLSWLLRAWRVLRRRPVVGVVTLRKVPTRYTRPLRERSRGPGLSVGSSKPPENAPAVGGSPRLVTILETNDFLLDEIEHGTSFLEMRGRGELNRPASDIHRAVVQVLCLCGALPLRELRPPHTCSYYPGFEPGFPVLPGVLPLDECLVRACMRRAPSCGRVTRTIGSLRVSPTPLT